ncbi:hypothetical protein ACIRD3_05415, partial [Kitasatospora sp. NPDC093550]
MVRFPAPAPAPSRVAPPPAPAPQPRAARTARRARPLVAGLLALAAVGAAPAAHARSDDGTAASVVPASALVLQRQFTAAAEEFGVPPGLLLALAYQESRWESHQGAPSTTGNYGVLGLTQVDVAAENAAAPGGTATARRGEDRPRPARPARPRIVDSPALHTLQAAADLIHRPAAQLRTDSAQNLRGGAALLARYRQQSGAAHPAAADPADPAHWYPAVARFGQAGRTGEAGEEAGRAFADRVYATWRQGLSRTTSEGQWLTLPGVPDLALPGPPPLPARPAPSTSAQTPECPPGLGCDFIPAAYALTDPGDPTSFGNYNP